jgi:isoleucyl-tRNA synthetase
VAINGVSPYKAVISQGFTLDPQGRKQSKSLGNTIEPGKVTNQLGADILRLWVASVDYESDVRVDMNTLNSIAEVYRKIRNTMRFLLANTSDFDAKKDAVAYEDLRSVDKYLMVRLNQEIKTIREKGYDSYSFSTVYKSLVNFCNNELSSFYLDFAKDVVYIEAENNYDRRAMQTVFYEVLVALTKLMTPILPHTAEEIWEYLQEEEEYVQLAELPGYTTYADQDDILELWNSFMPLRDNVLKALEEARNEKLIGKSFEAKVTLYPNEATKVLFEALNANLEQVLIVSGLEIAPVGTEVPEKALSFESMAVLVEKATGETCQRCRAVKEDVGSHEKLSNLCHRCATIVEENFPEALVEGLE